MRPHPLIALILAASMATPASAGMNPRNPLDLSVMASLGVAVTPLVVSVVAGPRLSDLAASERMKHNKRWDVTQVRPQGEQTAVELRSKDKTLKIELPVATATARSKEVQVRDELDIEPIGSSGYAVKKAGVTIAVLTQAGSGMAHSKPRN